MMLTRCPACETMFRVTPEQLKAKQGKVRCGQCQHVFNALDSLVDETGAASGESPVENADAPPVTEPGPGSEAVETHEGTSPHIPPEPVARLGNENGIDDPDGTAPIEYIVEKAGTEAEAEEEDVASAPAPEPAPEADPQPIESAPDGEMESRPSGGFPQIEPTLHEPVPAGRRAGLAWSGGVALALGLLIFQVLMQFRVEIAVLWPDSRPAMLSMCSLLGCDLPFPSKINQLSIESSDLHPAPQNGEVLVLTASLKNRAPFAQTPPHLELTLTDVADRPILRKVLAPADYLPKDANAAAGFPAYGDLTIERMFIPDAAINRLAAGYRLYLFYP